MFERIRNFIRSISPNRSKKSSGEKSDSPKTVFENPLLKPISLADKWAIFELFIPGNLKAGDADKIWPIISAAYGQKGKLGIRNSLVPRNSFYFMYSSNARTPLFRKGTYTAVYKIIKADSVEKYFDGKIYILRIYERDLKTSVDHMFNSVKIQTEYKLFSKYLINIYNYGVIKRINFDFVITDEYYTVGYDENYRNFDASMLTNKMRIDYIYNVVEMLNILYMNKHVHTDLKLINIGWNNYEELTPILIDFRNRKFIRDRYGYIQSFYVATTYPPEYISNNPLTPLEQYDMYSIGGLADIIDRLPIKYKVIDETSRQLSIAGLSFFLGLKEVQYSNINKYSWMLNVIDDIRKKYVE